MLRKLLLIQNNIKCIYQFAAITVIKASKFINQLKKFNCCNLVCEFRIINLINLFINKKNILYLFHSYLLPKLKLCILSTVYSKKVV